MEYISPNNHPFTARLGMFGFTKKTQGKIALSVNAISFSHSFPVESLLPRRGSGTAVRIFSRVFITDTICSLFFTYSN